MARFTSSTFGKISGKHGSAVAAIRKDGLNILKVYRIASNPNTTGQKNQRGKFGFVMKELNCLRKVFTQTYGGQYGINKAIALTMKTAVTGEFPEFRLDYSKLPISNGSLNKLEGLKPEQVNSTTLKISWSDQLYNLSSHNDIVNLVCLHTVKKQFIIRNNATRSICHIETEIPVGWLLHDIHCWIFLSSPNTNSFSTSQYIPLTGIGNL
jgi:hypothetical protein